MLPETQYAKNGDVSIAFQVFGDGAQDLVIVPGFVSNVEIAWEEPQQAAFLRKLARFFRVIVFDKRGTGLSDRIEVGTLEVRMDDVRAVMDAARSERAALFAISEGGCMSLLFAATYPERTTAVIFWGATSRYSWASDYPIGQTDEWFRLWGSDAVDAQGTPIRVSMLAKSKAADKPWQQWYARKCA